ncbi:MAG: 16S rRNA (guanine(966)-N(2))-methyltransferase RsmD [Geobacter sp.]|nr:16S rRNA (guanine(966)-N(2))-methyltransferase RsmD [Geobacter sp.]
MRVISGTARGRKLLSLKDERVRPTADRIKEAIFNILASRMSSFDGLRVLDIFAGTGNLGIEALSRGATQGIFVDNHRESTAIIRKNLEALGFADRSLVIMQNVQLAINTLDRKGEQFDLAFLDPPYGKGLVEKTLELLSSSPLLAPEAIIVAELGYREELPQRIGHLEEFDRRRYGDTAVSFWSVMESE